MERARGADRPPADLTGCSESTWWKARAFRTKIRLRQRRLGAAELQPLGRHPLPDRTEQSAYHGSGRIDPGSESGPDPPRPGACHPKFFNVVVVQPSCSIVGKLPQGDARICRMDQLVTKIRSTDPSALDILKLVCTRNASTRLPLI